MYIYITEQCWYSGTTRWAVFVAG